MNKRNRKKGFTLVEVIVVLVILAILAALMIPALTGWIDRANERSAIVEARQVLLAAQTMASEIHAGVLAETEYTTDNILTLAEVGGTLAAVPTRDSTTDRITGFSYVAANGHTVTYDHDGDPTFDVT